MDDLKKFILDDTEYETRLSRKYELRKPWMPANPNLLNAQIPGVIRHVHAHPGQSVKRGDPLVVLEAMKMRNTIVSPIEAKVRAVVVQPGQMVMKGQLLVEFE